MHSSGLFRTLAPMKRSTPRAIQIALLLSACLLTTVAGCSQRGGGIGLFSSEGLRVSSSLTGATLDVQPRSGVFFPIDEQSADIYLTDLPTDVILRLAEGDRSVLTEDPPVGSVVHIHMFLLPNAGRTPIDFEASNFTVTHVVFAGLDTNGDPAVGQYGGGGFLLPSDDLEGDRFDAVIRGASLTYMTGTQSFVDRLDGAELDGSFRLGRDRVFTAAIRSALRRVVSSLPE